MSCSLRYMTAFSCAGVPSGSMSACLRIMICILSSRMFRATLLRMSARMVMYRMARAKKLRLSKSYNLYVSVSTMSRTTLVTVLWNSETGMCRRVMSQPRAISSSAPNVAALLKQSAKTPALPIQSGRYPILLTVFHFNMPIAHATILNRGTMSIILCSVVMVAACITPN